MAKNKTNANKVLNHFNNTNDANRKKFSTGGTTTTGVINDYQNYKAPKTWVGPAPAKKKGGAC